MNVDDCIDDDDDDDDDCIDYDDDCIDDDCIDDDCIDNQQQQLININTINIYLYFSCTYSVSRVS